MLHIHIFSLFSQNYGLSLPAQVSIPPSFTQSIPRSRFRPHCHRHWLQPARTPALILTEEGRWGGGGLFKLSPYFVPRGCVESHAMDDILDSSLNLEETHFKEGYDEGYADGLIAGKDEGKQVGLKVGFEVGEELGFYRGCVDIWTSAIRVDPTLFSSRAKMGITQMKELHEKYPLMDPENLEVQEIMNSLRLKFKMVCSSLHVKLDYNGYLKSSAEASDIQF